MGSNVDERQKMAPESGQPLLSAYRTVYKNEK
jgi:hypothetical protein